MSQAHERCVYSRRLTERPRALKCRPEAAPNDFFLRPMWEKRIACQTYRKQPYELWPQEEFADAQVRLKNGTTVSWKLAECGVLLGAKQSEQIGVREVRKLTERGLSSCLETAFC